MYANNPNLYQELNARNIIPRMEEVGLVSVPGRHISPEDGKIHKNRAIDTGGGWIYVNPNPEMLCMEYQLLVKAFGFIPQRCLECYKVVVMPRSFHELMLLLELEENVSRENSKVWCKCGIEQRDFVPRNYGGYFYCKGLEVGKSRYKTVRKLIDENISPGTNVILKRYCTEFELMFGPSDRYQQPEGAKETEKRYWDNADVAASALKQPPWVRDNVIQNWMMFAWGRGDKTVTFYNDGKPLFSPYVTYHEGKE